ncbi:hypothetical protein L2X99_13300 [Microbacterium sp. KUDC0406]|uniref:hypothetical protein n=1 Tax=Microbacterium sp. KUDC0406 TaxID=2909588 RepID=UPI001F413103|nr:hypothetical protein [Microbacterium sp. KUDC0406]UJP09397.1 hypothetical protein L2X99_13300 [Microbacterium sp. KUDC0406]
MASSRVSREAEAVSSLRLASLAQHGARSFLTRSTTGGPSSIFLAATLVPAATRSLSNGLRIFGNVLVTLGAVGGAAAVMLMGIQTLRSPGNDFGWGGPVLLFGMLAVLPLLSSAARSIVSPRR